MANLLEEAKLWVGTPYHLGAVKRGVGCDCCTFLVGVMVACGVLTWEEVDDIFVDIGYYIPSNRPVRAGLRPLAHDWFANTDVERYLRAVLRCAREIVKTRCYASVQVKPGSIVLTKAVNSKLWNHGGIVVAWPKIIHSVDPQVVITNASRDPMWAYRELAVFEVEPTQ
jgi:cell wall-associated NlpC family hydrolase